MPRKERKPPTVEELRRELLTQKVSPRVYARREKLADEFIKKRLPLNRFIPWMAEHGGHLG